jgi:hypothetical protein
MPVQLPLLSDRDQVAGSTWSQLPAQARAQVVELFSELLLKSARCASSLEEPANESLEDTSDSRQP